VPAEDSVPKHQQLVYNADANKSGSVRDNKIMSRAAKIDLREKAGASAAAN